MSFKPATYVTIWDGGTQIRTQCEFNPETKEVQEVDSVEEGIEDLDICEEEFIEFQGEKIVDFYNLDIDQGFGSFEEN